MSKLAPTLEELSEALETDETEFVLTRFNMRNVNEPNDLDILVKPNFFKETIKILIDNGYISSSHDQALGGRIAGMQKNLIKTGRIKIDLHQDFTWRKSRYLDLNLIWENLEERTINGVKIKTPRKKIDVFIVTINIIFEKTYITKEDFKYLETEKDYFGENVFREQAEKYGWLRTYKGFLRWWEGGGSRTKSFPAFLPASLIIFSYVEKLIHDKKLDLVSLLYYFFFRTRYLINKTLPYE